MQPSLLFNILEIINQTTQSKNKEKTEIFGVVRD